MLETCEEAAGTQKSSGAGLKGSGARLYPRRSDVPFGKGKVRSPVVPNARGSVRRLRVPSFHLRVGCGLLFGSVFIVAVGGSRSG